MADDWYSKILPVGGKKSGKQSDQYSYPDIDTDAREKTEDAITSVMKPMRKARKELMRNLKGGRK